jgi:hypothetical protein
MESTPEVDAMAKKSQIQNPMSEATRGRVPSHSQLIPRALSSAIELYNARRGMRASLVAANHRVATLRVDSGWSHLSTGHRLTLDGKDGGLGPVQFHVQVMHDPRVDEGAKHRFVQVRWVLVSTLEKRAYLVNVLRDILGIDARIVTLSACGEDVLGTHRKLLFEADKQRVRLINVGESILPSPGEPVVASTPSVHDPDAPLDKRTQPGIVISTLGGGGA